MSSDRYETLAAPHSAEIPKIKGSRFIGDAFPVESPEAADERIGEVRKRYHAASHHCFAYRLGPEGVIFRSSDDGEPSGSAGAPILRQIESSGLSDVLVVVTRYFGGTKLGTGGLVRAYGDAADFVLNAAKRQTRQLYTAFELVFAYNDTAPVMRLIDRFGARVVTSRYAEGTTLRVEVPTSRADAFAEAFVDDLGARGEINPNHKSISAV